MSEEWQGAKIEELIGKTFFKVYVGKGKDELVFETQAGDKYVFYHEQDCCEDVKVEDICGELSHLVGSPINIALESTSEGSDEKSDSFTWTFYIFATAKGYVTVRWFGESNGCYSESVNLKKYIRVEKSLAYLVLVEMPGGFKADMIFESIEDAKQRQSEVFAPTKIQILPFKKKEAE